MTKPHNLPAELTSFVGRERELAELRSLLRRCRLLTLTGPGGAGKTRLAVRVATGVMARYPGGAWFVDTDSVTSDESLQRAIAAACDVREVGARPLFDMLADRLSSKPAFLLIDRAERVLAPAGALVERLLRSAPALSIVVTSREPLKVPGETVWRTPPLTLPADASGVRGSEAVRLFLDRAAMTRPGFAVDPSAERDLTEVCVRLDGLPLAIELAARLVDAMSVREILARLREREHLVRRGRHAVPRDEPLQRAIDSSFELLLPGERELFARLAVFVGGCDAEAAEAVGSMDGEDVLPTLMRLVDKSLVVAELRGGARTRYRMLDTIREYALDRVPPALSADAERRHAAHFLALARTAGAELRGGDQAEWLDRIQAEMPNLRAAFEWHAVHSPDSMAALAGHLARYWYVRGDLGEGLEWLDRALAPDVSDPGTRLRAYVNRARLRRFRGDYDGAIRDAEECVRLGRETGSDLNVMGGLVTLGNISASLGEWQAAARYFSEALSYQQATTDDALVSGGLNNLALVESAQGHHDEAKSLIDRALECADRAGDRILRSSIRESAGRIERRRGDPAIARGHYLKALELASEFSDVVNLTDVLDGMSLLAVGDRDHARALTLAAASAHMREENQSHPQRWDQLEVEAGIARARSSLGAAAARAAWNRGLGMTMSDAVAFATGAAAVRRPNGVRLTPRELQVAALIAEGLTNGEIGARLRMAERTADAHVEHIRNKLGLHARAQIAVWIHDHVVSV